VHKEEAFARARALDDDGEQRGLLWGVPVAVKDNILVQDKPTTAASKILENYTATYDATVVKKLNEQGAVIVGKTNMDEFAMGSSNETSAFGAVKNPHDISRVPGGSSGGSAAVVAADMAMAALGTDTGGSIRQPASLCGVVGLKPTYGAVSRYGVIALSSSLDQVGPLVSSVQDAARVFEAIAGHDPFDATSAKRNMDGVSNFDNFETKQLTIGVPKEYFIDGIQKEVKESAERAVQKLEKDGFKVREVSLPHTSYALSVYYIIMPAEASANLARYDGIRYARLDDLKGEDLSLFELYEKQRGQGFGEEARRRILLGTFVLSSGYYDAYYSKAQKVRRLICQDFEKVFDDGVDVLATPVTPTTAFKIGEKANDPLAMYLSDIFTIPANMAGLPALSLPTGEKDENDLPIGFQLIGQHFEEKKILALGDYFQTQLA